MTDHEVDIAATVEAMRAVLMTMLGTQAVLAGGDDTERRRAYLNGLREVVMAEWNAGSRDGNNPEFQPILQRVPTHIRAMFDDLDVG